MIQITKVTDLGQDILEVRGFDDANPATELIATGWLSAMSNHYQATDYDIDGNLLAAATPHAMTDTEKTIYWASLLQAQIPQLATPVPESVLFINPVAQATLEQAQATQGTDSQLTI